MRDMDVQPPPYNAELMNSEFGVYKHLDRASSFENEKYSNLVTRLFRIDGGFEWTLAHEGDRLYLKAWLRFPLHKFLSDLFRYHFRCPLAQMSPNAIRTILWYIAVCTKDGR